MTGDDWEAALVAKAKGEKLSKDESDDEVDEPGMAEDEPPVISTKVAVAHVRDLLTFAMQSGNKSMVDGIICRHAGSRRTVSGWQLLLTRSALQISSGSDC